MVPLHDYQIILLTISDINQEASMCIRDRYTPGDGFDIPIIRYTSGISVQGGIWFCGLRYSKVEPRKWYEKYGIDDYVYYTIRLEEDKPSSKGTVYVKISK